MRISEQNRLADLLERVRPELTGFPPRKKYLAGVSGGRDSIVLLHILHALGYKELVVCHLDHRLRGAASRADAKLVEKTATALGYHFELGEADVRAHALATKNSLESAARDMRHRFFRACAKDHHCKVIFLAHHADDQVETCLFNFLRGTGAAGLGGMKSHALVEGLKFVRPLLGISRAEITGYAKENRLRYRDDASNAGTAHTRNRLRHDVLPAIEKAVGPTFRSAILRTAQILREEESWMDSLVPKTAATLSCAGLREMPLALRRRTVLRWLKSQDIEEPGFAETERVLSLLDADAGPAKVNLPGSAHARRRAGNIFIERP